MNEGSEESGAPSESSTGSAEKIRILVTVIGFLVPVTLYFWLISAYGVNMLRADQWFDVKLIHDSSAGTLSFGELWAPHGENRVFFQNVFTLFLGRFFNYNVVVEEYVSATLLVGASALLVLAHRRRSPSTPGFWYCPVAFLLLTVAQWGGTLYGYSFGWYLIVACLAMALFFLDKVTLSWVAWSVAALAVIIASFSSLQGLFLWLAGLTILLQRGRSRRMILAWIAAALLTTGLYFYGWSAAQGSGVSYALGHIGETLQYFFFVIGNVVSVSLPNSPHGAQYAVMLFGVATFAVAVWSLLRYGFRADDTSSRPLGVALIWVGLMFAAGAAGARTADGISNASFTLYVSFDVLILLGCFLVAIDRTPVDGDAQIGRPRSALGVRLAIGGLVLVQIVAGMVNGLSHGHDYRGYEVTGAIVTARIGEAPDGLVGNQLGAGYESAAFIRLMTAYARSQHLSLFSTAQVRWYEAQTLPRNRTAPVVTIGNPRLDDVIHGVTFLDAGASDPPYGVSDVRFFAREDGGPSLLVARAEPTKVGWLAAWDTKGLPNGTYSIQAVASSPGGLHGSSPWVLVQLRN